MTTTAALPRPPAAALRRLLPAEGLRLAGRRFGLVLPVTGLSLLVLAVYGSVAADGSPAPDGARATVAALQLAGSMLLFAMLFGALLVTTDAQARTLGFTVLVARRRSIVAAKALTAAIVGALYGAAGVAGALAAVHWALPAHGVTPVWPPDTGVLFVAVPAVSAAGGALGVGVGFLLRSGVAAVGALIVWTIVAEPAVLSMAPALGRWLPGGAYAAVTDDPALADRLGRPGGLLVLAAWLAVVLVAATVTFDRRPL